MNRRGDLVGFGHQLEGKLAYKTRQQDNRFFYGKVLSDAVPGASRKRTKGVPVRRWNRRIVVVFVFLVHIDIVSSVAAINTVPLAAVVLRTNLPQACCCTIVGTSLLSNPSFRDHVVRTRIIQCGPLDAPYGQKYHLSFLQRHFSTLRGCVAACRISTITTNVVSGSTAAAAIFAADRGGLFYSPSRRWRRREETQGLQDDCFCVWQLVRSRGQRRLVIVVIVLTITIVAVQDGIDFLKTLDPFDGVLGQKVQGVGKRYARRVITCKQQCHQDISQGLVVGLVVHSFATLRLLLGLELFGIRRRDEIREQIELFFVVMVSIVAVSSIGRFAFCDSFSGLRDLLGDEFPNKVSFPPIVSVCLGGNPVQKGKRIPRALEASGVFHREIIKGGSDGGQLQVLGAPEVDPVAPECHQSKNIDRGHFHQRQNGNDVTNNSGTCRWYG
mmetsp:Transcript_11241/g.26121  ORF Transcript_11241/g.26121 Transcript_11241/m.26121 type:complete len:442 (+) Transcript_11241:335-1660(+)